MCEVIRTAIVDDHHLFRSGVISILATSQLVEVVGCGENATDALQLAKELLPDVILIDLSMPGGGINAISAIAHAYPFIRIGVLTVSESDDDVIRSFAAGAHSYILKGIGGSDLTSIVQDLGRGLQPISPQIAVKLMQELGDKFSALSTREHGILKLLLQQREFPEIAVALGMTEDTLKKFINNAICRLQVLYRANSTTRIDFQRDN